MRERERRRRERKREREREGERAIILGGKKKWGGHLIHLRKRNCTDFVNLQLTSISTFPSRTSAFHGNVHLEAAAMPAKNHPRQLTRGKPAHQTPPPRVVLWYQPPRSVKRLEKICAFFFPLICRWWQLGDALEMCIHGSHQSWEFSPWFHLVRRNELEGSAGVGSLGSVEVPVESLAFGGRLGRWWGELCFVPNAPRFLGLACCALTHQMISQIKWVQAYWRHEKRLVQIQKHLFQVPIFVHVHGWIFHDVSDLQQQTFKKQKLCVTVSSGPIHSELMKKTLFS